MAPTGRPKLPRRGPIPPPRRAFSHSSLWVGSKNGLPPLLSGIKLRPSRRPLRTARRMQSGKSTPPCPCPQQIAKAAARPLCGNAPLPPRAGSRCCGVRPLRQSRMIYRNPKYTYRQGMAWADRQRLLGKRVCADLQSVLRALEPSASKASFVTS